MPRYLISFDDGAMDFLEGDLVEVGEAAHRVLRDAKAANVWVTGGGLMRQQATCRHSRMHSTGPVGSPQPVAARKRCAC